MLSIGKIAAGPNAAAYYADQVAPDATGYYVGEGESAGTWTGTGATQLGLEGEVTREQLDAVLAGAGRRQLQEGAVGGFDLTFRAPKSVSVLWAVGDPALADELRAGHDAAVADAMGYLEREACGVRRGKGGTLQLKGDGFVSAQFTHRTSRAGDPLLHTHVVTGNVTQGPDGRWTALDARHLYHQAKTAGFLYQAALREQLTDRLGLDWTPVEHGVADVAGVSREVIDEFSQRRHQILDRMSERGERSAAAAQIAALDTRQAKQHEPLAHQRAEWRARAAEHGLDREDIADLPRRDLQLAIPRDADLRALTEQSSTFLRSDLLRELAERAPHGADVAALERRADAALNRPDAVHVGEDALKHPRYSSAELLDIEQRLTAQVDERRNAFWPRARDADADQALARRPTIGEDQADAVRHLVTGRDGIAAVRAPAGTGKTFALDAAREAWEQSGTPVLGCALSARAALELEDQAGIPSTTIARLLHSLDEGHHLPHDGVLVVDEAGMVGTRDLARLADAAQSRDAKLVLVGDDRQLPEIDAGGAFRALADGAPAVELRAGRRQREGWDREALDALRNGEVERWARAYREHGRITIADTAEDARRALVNDWSRADGDAVMIAHRRSDVADLNARGRELRRADGRLGPDEVSGRDEHAFSAGDRVVATRNDRHLGLLNGQRGTVTAVDPAQASVTIDLGDDRTIEVGQAHLQRGDLDHGYAITAHRAQGATVDRAFVLGSEDLYREWGYTALSRHREESRFYVARGDLGLDADRAPEPDPLASGLSRLLGRSDAERLASDHLRELTDEQLQAERERLGTRLSEAPPPEVLDERPLERARSLETSARSHLEFLTEQREKTSRFKLSERRGLGEHIAAAEERYEATKLERQLRELEHLEYIGNTKLWRKLYEDVAEDYLAVVAEHGDRLQLSDHAAARVDELQLSASRLDPPTTPGRELPGVGPEMDVDGPDLGP